VPLSEESSTFDDFVVSDAIVYWTSIRTGSIYGLTLAR